MQSWGPNRHRRVVALIVAAASLAVGCTGNDSGDDEAKKPPKSTTTTTVKPVLSEDFSIASILGFDAQFATIEELAGLAKLDAKLEEDGPFTLFAPNTEAFAVLNADDLAALKADPAGELTSVLSLHVVAGKLSYADLVAAGGTSLESIDGQQLPVAVEGQVVKVGGATLIKSDIQADNGVIHVLDAVAMAG